MSSGDGFFLVTERERQVLVLVVRGSTDQAIDDQAIAEELGIAKNTVQSHRRNIRNKLRTSDRAHWRAVAEKHGLTGTGERTGNRKTGIRRKKS